VPEEYSQEELIVPAEEWEPHLWKVLPETISGYRSYQLIRSVLAAYAQNASFCVMHDARRPDLREAWFEVMAAVKSADLRVRLKVLTWQELAAVLPGDLQDFLDRKYGIVPPSSTPWWPAEGSS
jgi:Restriction Endonuclease associating with ARP